MAGERSGVGGRGWVGGKGRGPRQPAIVGWDRGDARERGKSGGAEATINQGSVEGGKGEKGGNGKEGKRAGRRATGGAGRPIWRCGQVPINRSTNFCYGGGT